jgi:hypothetical protein
MFFSSVSPPPPPTTRHHFSRTHAHSLTHSQAVLPAARAAVAAKGSYGTGAGEEMMGWLPVLWSLREYADTLEGLAGGEAAPPDVSIFARPDGRGLAVRTFPYRLDAVLFGGLAGEVWLRPEVEEVTFGEGVRRQQQQQLKQPPASPASPQRPAVATVLGAGNHLPVIATDILHCLAAEGRPVLCKLNPVNAYVGPHLAAAFAPLVEAGLVRLAYGGADVGEAACADARVATVHLTGSVATFDAVVWGPGPAGAAAKAARTRRLAKPVTAELGCVTPVLVIPGPAPWSPGDLAYSAAEAVAGLILNAGHNCLKPELILVPAAWPQRAAFVDAVRRVLDAAPRRCAYYPGSASRAAAFVSVGGKGHTEALGARPAPGTPGVTFAPGAGDGSGGSADFDTCGAGPILPWLFRPGLRPGEAVTTTENWVACLQEVGLPGPGDGGGAYIDAALAFANDACFGSLSCQVVAHPSAQPGAVEAAVAGLRYGSVCVNVSPLLACSIPTLPWGAWRADGADTAGDAAIGSGNAAVHNARLVAGVEKVVLRGAWRVEPAHLWSPSHRNLEAAVGAALDYFCAAPGRAAGWGARVVGLLKVAAAALRG